MNSFDNIKTDTCIQWIFESSFPAIWGRSPRYVFNIGALGLLCVHTHPVSPDILPRFVYPLLRQTTYRIPICLGVPQVPWPIPSSCYREAPASGAFPSLGNTPWGLSLHSHTQTHAGSRPLRGFGAVVAACLAEWDTLWCWYICRLGHLDSCNGPCRHRRRLFAIKKSTYCCVPAFHGVWQKWRGAKWHVLLMHC